jgi:hypothetical protein
MVPSVADPLNQSFLDHGWTWINPARHRRNQTHPLLHANGGEGRGEEVRFEKCPSFQEPRNIQDPTFNFEHSSFIGRCALNVGCWMFSEVKPQAAYPCLVCPSLWPSPRSSLPPTRRAIAPLRRDGGAGRGKKPRAYDFCPSCENLYG